MDELLQDALADFENVTLQPSSAKNRAVKAKEAAAVPDFTPSTFQAPADPPAPPAPVPSLAGPKGLGALDPLKRKQPAKPQPKPPSFQEAAIAATFSAPPPPPQLQPDAQRLADELMNLVKEAGLSGDPSMDSFAEAFQNADLQALLEQAQQASDDGSDPYAGFGDPFANLGAELFPMLNPRSANATSTSQTAAAADEDDADFSSSSMLRGLVQHTQQTVNQQAKKTRGQAAPSVASGAAAGKGLLPFGDLLGSLGMGGGGDAESSPHMNVMVDYIMQNLLSKEVLYTPLKDIEGKYPPWLEANQGKMPADEFQRYVMQYESIQRVCKQYEDAPDDYKKVVSLIQEMQTYGDPPAEIVEQMGAGLNMAEGSEGMADNPELAGELNDMAKKCCIQ